MVATAAQIGFVIAEYRTAVASDSTVKDNYGEQARDTGADVIESFFEDDADAQVIVDERLALVSADRRRFRQTVNRCLSFTGGLDFSQVTPTITVIDDERSANHAAAIVEIAVQAGEDKTVIVSWG